MKTNYLNHTIYRIFAPPLVAIFVYLLILLIFDRLSEITNNFSPEELLFLIVVTYSLFELYRFWIQKVEKISYFNTTPFLKYLAFYLGGFLITSIVVIGLFAMYFTFFLGISEFTSELISFLIVFALVGILYHLFYLSIQFLDRQKSLLLQKEELNRKNIEFELEVFKNRINPDFLFQSLSSVISLIRKKRIDDAEIFIDRLALFYRKILGNRYSEIISLEEEIQKVNEYLQIQNFRYSNNFQVNWCIKSVKQEINVVPNTILQVVQIIECSQMVDCNTELHVDVFEEGDAIVFQFLSSERLNLIPHLKLQIKALEKALGFYSNQKVLWLTEGKHTQIQIPKIKLED